MDNEIAQLFLEVVIKLRLLIIYVFLMGIVNFLFSFYLFVKKKNKEE